METSYYSKEFAHSFYSEEETIRFYDITAKRHLNLNMLLTESFVASENQQLEMQRDVKNSCNSNKIRFNKAKG